jgi:hypothetical protein
MLAHACGPALRKLMKENLEFQASLSYIVKTLSQKKKLGVQLI